MKTAVKGPFWTTLSLFNLRRLHRAKSSHTLTLSPQFFGSFAVAYEFWIGFSTYICWARNLSTGMAAKATVLAPTDAAAYASSPVGRRIESVVLPRQPSVVALPRSAMVCRCTASDVFSVSKSGFDYLGQSTRGDLNLNYGTPFRLCVCLFCLCC